METALIHEFPAANLRPSFYTLSLLFTKLILNKYGMLKSTQNDLMLYSHKQLYVYICKYMLNIINTMSNFNERTNALLYKNIISHPLSLKGWCWLCVRDELETGTDCYIDPKFFFDHSSTSFASWLGCSTVGHWGPQALCLQAYSHACILSPTDPNWLKPSVPWLYYCLTSTCFRYFSSYTGASLDWRLGRGSIYNT